MLEYLLVHVLDGALVVFFVQPEEVSQFLLALGLRVKVHVQLLLQTLPGLHILCLLAHPLVTIIKCLIRALRFVATRPKESRFVSVIFFLLLRLVLVKLLLRLLMLSHLLVKDVEVLKRLTFERVLFVVKDLLLEVLSPLLVMGQRLGLLLCTGELQLDLLLQMSRGSETRV